MVIFNAKDHGQVPQTGHVGTLPNLSLVRCSIAIASDSDLHGLSRRGIVMISECQPQPHGHLRAHDALPAIKVVRLVVEVHGSALPLRLAANVAEQLGEYALDRPPAGQCRAVAAVRGDPRVFEVERRVDAGSHRLLPVVQVAKSANGARLVLVVARDFHTAHGVHEFEVGEELFLRHVNGVVRLRFDIVGLEGSRQVKSCNIRGHESHVGGAIAKSGLGGGGSGGDSGGGGRGDHRCGRSP
mmetsp:Transcript_34837/g.74253  ORF Transcript_34837/g.74253 Transcript_34837/m.74253 type:complete len:242 (-) Transcript_34837:148-873(-)